MCGFFKEYINISLNLIESLLIKHASIIFFCTIQGDFVQHINLVGWSREENDFMGFFLNQGGCLLI